MNSSLQQRLEKAGQQHLVKFIDELSEEERKEFIDELESIDYDCIEKLLRPTKAEVCEIRPFENTEKATKECTWEQTGLEVIAEGKAAVLMLAGGQGTRLGFDHPKGCYDLGLPSHKSLFQFQSERIISLQNLAKKRTGKDGKVLFIVMTNKETAVEIKEFFMKNKYFGLEEEDVKFFSQGMLPAVSEDGKILLEAKGHVALSPNGNGGVYKGLAGSGLLDYMEERGVQYIVQTSVDNVLNKMADPILIGCMKERGYDCCSKVVRKRDSKEAVGVLAYKDDKAGVVEYSEISGTLAEATTANGELLFGAAHICNNGYELSFLRRVSEDYLPFHKAHKKVPFINEAGMRVIPDQPNAYKFEMFIFDAFAHSKSMGALEVKRSEEFAPLKNADSAGVDCPRTCKEMFCTQSRSWLEHAGAIIDSTKSDICEVSPLLSYNGEGLEKYKGQRIVLPCIVE